MAGRHAKIALPERTIPVSAQLCPEAPYAQTHHLAPTRVKRDSYMLLCIHCKKSEQELRSS